MYVRLSACDMCKLGKLNVIREIWEVPVSTFHVLRCHDWIDRVLVHEGLSKTNIEIISGFWNK